MYIPFIHIVVRPWQIRCPAKCSTCMYIELPSATKTTKFEVVQLSTQASYRGIAGGGLLLKIKQRGHICAELPQSLFLVFVTAVQDVRWEVTIAFTL